MNEERGIITRIYLENFVTYNKVTIKPDRNLNVIIGPNGTGKSTIVCAIVIGLGGKPKLIGRATQVGAYVKTGCDNAKIEIELVDIKDKRITIVRKFNKANQTTWQLNGKDVHNREIQELIKSMNIQVDNLCQFLPQDKVQDFSKMNSQELLENTERSVGDPKLVEYHDKLKDYRKSGKDFESNVANKTRLLESETHKFEGMKEIVGGIKEKRAITNKIKLLKQKRAWISYDLNRKRLCEAKKDRDKAASEMKKLDEKLRPINEAIKKLEARITEMKKSAELHNAQLSTKTSKVTRLRDEILNKEREIREIELNCKHKIQAEENRDQEINVVVQQKNKLDNDLQVLLADVGPEEKLLAEQDRMNLEVQQKRSEVEKLTREITADRTQVEHIDATIRMLNAEMQAAQDIDTKRMELLRHRSADAYRGVLWLRENRDKFSSVIHEPIMLTIDVKDASYSKYFETVISYRDLVAFVCEDKSDMNRLLGFLRGELKLKVNVVHSDPHKDVRTTPVIPLEQLRPFGFQYYLLSLIEAPETVIKYLVTMNHIHNIPIGTSEVEKNVDHIPGNLSLYFSADNCFSVNCSKYTNAKSTRMSGVKGSGSLSIIQDAEKLREIKGKLEKLHDNREQIMEEIRELEGRRKTANDEVEIKRVARQQSQRNIQNIQALKSRIKVEERRLSELQNNRTSIETIRGNATREIQKVLKVQTKVYVQYNVLLSDCYQFVTMNAQNKLMLETQKRKYSLKKIESQDLREQCAAAEETFRRLDNALEPRKRETEKLYKVALELTNGVDPSSPDFKPINTAFAKLPLTVDEIEVELETAQAKAYCLGEAENGEAILANYEKTEKNVAKLQAEIEELKVQQTVMEQQIEEIRGLWLTPLQELIRRINKNFSTYFGLMGCAGEVTLKQADNPNDYDQYGLMIRVKFRDADELQELTRQHQSGGERAVTTAVYMIALQELSRVPFRCVDEINQGMDAVNERRVFQLIVQITGKSNNSQYFFLTPKLLPDLEYGDHATIHCVFNGPFMIPSTDYDTATYCSRFVAS